MTIEQVHFWDGILASQDHAEAGYKEPGWYFWLETYAHVVGPFLSRANAEVGLKEYVKNLK